MSRVVHLKQESSTGAWARNVRMVLQLTQQELADMCGISPEEVDLFERNLPVKLDARRKLLKELWASRNALCHTFPR